MKACGRGVTNWGACLEPSRIAGHEVSRSGVSRCAGRSQAHTANGSASYFHRRQQDTKNRLRCSLGADLIEDPLDGFKERGGRGLFHSKAKNTLGRECGARISREELHQFLWMNA